MGDDKKTQLGTGTGNLARPTGSQSVAPSYTPIPVGSQSSGPVNAAVPPGSPTAGGTGAPGASSGGSSTAMKTSYLPGSDVDPLIGQALAGRYLISKKLGEGGMGAVYLATHQILEKQVALKVLHNEFARKPDLVERFMQEAKSASRIRHENVIDISDFGQTPEGMVFFAMELLKGHDLHEEIARARLDRQLLPWARTKPIFLQICAALTAAHSHGIVHRDLKPENIYLVEFLGEPDFVKLLDFGIAKMTEVNEGDRKLTKTGMLFGTPEYMSPEQARGDQVDHRVDVYAMGCILFQLVTGRVPFEADNFMGVLSLHLTEMPPSIPPEVFDHIGAPREIANIIDRALAKDRDQRWQTIADLANAVRIACGDAPVLERGNTPVPRVASVAAPATTTSPATTTTGLRQRTKWTGNVSVPEAPNETRAPAASGSRTPLILGIVAVVIAGGGVAAFLATRHSGETVAAGTGSAGSANVAPANPTTGQAPVTPPGPGSNTVAVAQPIAPQSPLPDSVKIELDSTPRNAEIVDDKGHTIGHTPMKLNLRGSRDAKDYALHLKGYGDALVELVPDRDINYVAKLEKGDSTTPAVVQHVPRPNAPTTPGPATKPVGGGSAVISVTVPDLGPRPSDPVIKTPDPVKVPDPVIKAPEPVVKPPDPVVKPPTPVKPPDDDDAPTIKKQDQIPGLQQGSAAP